MAVSFLRTSVFLPPPTLPVFTMRTSVSRVWGSLGPVLRGRRAEGRRAHRDVSADLPASVSPLTGSRDSSHWSSPVTWPPRSHTSVASALGRRDTSSPRTHSRSLLREKVQLCVWLIVCECGDKLTAPCLTGGCAPWMPLPSPGRAVSHPAHTCSSHLGTVAS